MKPVESKSFWDSLLHAAPRLLFKLLWTFSFMMKRSLRKTPIFYIKKSTCSAENNHCFLWLEGGPGRRWWETTGPGSPGGSCAGSRRTPKTGKRCTNQQHWSWEMGENGGRSGGGRRPVRRWMKICDMTEVNTWERNDAGCNFICISNCFIIR